MNTELAYLLGMITGKGTIIRDKNETEVRIEIPHQNITVEGLDTSMSVKASLIDIKSSLEPLIGKTINVSSSAHLTIISFDKNNGDFLIREINNFFVNYHSCKDFRIPDEMFKAPSEIRIEYLRGLADVTAHVRSSNNYMCKKGEPCYNHRVYIEIPVNWFLAVDIANLLKDLDVPVHTINWGHPNTRDPELKDYNSGKQNTWFREHQIKIFTDEFEKIGFKIYHKMKVLEKLSKINKTEWDIYINSKIHSTNSLIISNKLKLQVGNLKSLHHKYYWERREINKTKQPHPMESDLRIPEIIRDIHFNSWKEISQKLGYGPA